MFGFILLLILVQDAHAGKRNGKSSDFVCITKKKKEKGRWQEGRGKRFSPKNAKWNCTECYDGQSVVRGMAVSIKH